VRRRWKSFVKTEGKRVGLGESTVRCCLRNKLSHNVYEMSKQTNNLTIHLCSRILELNSLVAIAGRSGCSAPDKK
jgi:hypothetical protein